MGSLMKCISSFEKIVLLKINISGTHMALLVSYIKSGYHRFLASEVPCGTVSLIPSSASETRIWHPNLDLNTNTRLVVM